MARALDFGAVEVDVAVGEAELLVTAAVIEHVDRVIDANGHEDSTPHMELTWHAELKVIKSTDIE
jgi:tRNA(Arg) A34 adenosine deaminase TadA